MPEEKLDLIIRILKSASEHTIASEIKTEVKCMEFLCSKCLLYVKNNKDKNKGYKITEVGILWLSKLKDVQEILK